MHSANAVSAEALPGVVVIGRNEGERLKGCLRSVRAFADVVVYVDSGSTDGSADWARGEGIVVVDLDLQRPFTAARARNEGLQCLLRLSPSVQAVQFVDGDCEVVDGWMQQALAFLRSHAEVAVVCGRRRERYPHRSIYNQLCDQEWDTPAGEAKACGGDAMMRVTALKAVGGYRETLIAGEEPELCVRLRAAGWRVWRLDAEMTLHDAAMTRLGQWWRRSRRAGYAFAEGAVLHGGPPERHWVRETRRALLWGAALPVLAVVSAALWRPACLWLLALYPTQIIRLGLRSGGTPPVRWSGAFFSVLGKLAEAQGALSFWRDRLLSRHGRLIEYK